MLRLANRELALDLLDPTDAADAARQGTRFCWGGYIWQVRDATGQPLLAGPEWPQPNPDPFNGQGLPESFRHRTRAGQPLTWQGNRGIALGIGALAADASGAVALTEPCPWTVTRSADHVVFQTRHAAAGFSYELTRTIELRDRTITSSTQLTNTADTPLALEWFAHPFWPLTDHRAQIELPAGTALPDNPGFALGGHRLTFKRAFTAESDSQFALLSLPPGRELTVAVDHPTLARVTFASSFVPDECPVWANAHTLSVEPYLTLRLAPGEARRWQLRHEFILR